MKSPGKNAPEILQYFVQIVLTSKTVFLNVCPII